MIDVRLRSRCLHILPLLPLPHSAWRRCGGALCLLFLLNIAIGRPLHATEAQPLRQAPPEPALDGLFALDPVAHGAWLYHDFCYRCHGDYASARQGAENDPQRVLDLMLEGTVGMAAMSQAAGGPLTRTEIDAIAAYIQRWESLGASPPLPLAVDDAIAARWPERNAARDEASYLAGDLERGARLFTQHCVVCHGATGEGGVGAPLATEWTVDWPDRTVRRTISHGIPRSAMIAWSQGRGGPLDEQEIADLTLYVLSLSPQAQIPGFLPEAATPPALPQPGTSPSATSSPATPSAAQAAQATPAPSDTATLPRSKLVIGLGVGVIAMLLVLALGAWRASKRR